MNRQANEGRLVERLRIVQNCPAAVRSEHNLLLSFFMILKSIEFLKLYQLDLNPPVACASYLPL